MKKLLCTSGVASSLVLFPPASFAAPLQDMQEIFIQWSALLFLLFAIVVGALVYLRKPREGKHTASLARIMAGQQAVQSVRPDTPVISCTRTMTAHGIGALIVMEGDKLAGIFTERDALNRVLTPGLDPRTTNVSEVMTRDPHCVPPTTTIGEAMQVVTRGCFRHLPVVENGKVLGLVSSGDLTHWLVKDEIGQSEELVDVAARS
ncbi:MAG TPA: CBS domain-containing protein [Burkholderiales bacterium]|nr:CBS domain-containing protein [Burkholderiales bacterium]